MAISAFKAPLAAGVLWLALSFGSAFPTQAEVVNTLENRQVEIAYLRPKSEALQPVYDDLVRRGVLEELRNFLAPLRLPRPIKVQTGECGGETQHYAPGGAATVCYEP